MDKESKKWVTVIVAGVVIFGAVAVTVIGCGEEPQATPTAVEREDTPPPYYYDAEHDRYWNPDHGHWHPGRPPEDRTTDLDEMGWLDSLDQATEAARADDTLILAYFHAEWCGWCKRLKEEVYPDPAVSDKMAGFTLLQVDIDQQPELAQRFEITGVPTTLFLNADGEPIMRRPGFMEAEAYLNMLNEAEGLAS